MTLRSTLRLTLRPMLCSAGALACVSLAIACAPSASEETSTTMSKLIVCGPDGGQQLAQGIDVSHYQGDIDWTQVKGDGIDFAFAKATEGLTVSDDKFAANWAGMQSAGIVRGAYHYFHPSDDATDQANFVVQTVGPLAANDLPIVLDLETTDGLAGSDVVADALTFLAAVEQATGRTPIVYTSNRVITQVLDATSPDFAQYALWDVNYSVPCPTVPSPWSTWTFWQTGDTGVVAGTSAGVMVDLDTFNGTVGDLNTFLLGTSDSGTPSAPDGGNGGDAGSADLDGGVDDDASPPPSDGTSDSGGCACSVDRGAPSSSPLSILFLAFALGGVLVRKRASGNGRFRDS